MGGTGAGGGAVKKGAASSSKRARHSLSEEGSGRVPAESSDAEPCESSQDSLQAFDRVLNDPINGAEDEEIEDSVIFRTKQDVSWEEKAVDLASQLRTELKINYWQIQVGRRRRVSVFWEGDGVSNKGVVVKTCALKGIRVLYDIDKQTHWEDPESIRLLDEDDFDEGDRGEGLEDESKAKAFVQNLVDDCKRFEKDMSELFKGSPLSVVMLGNTGDGESSFANWTIQVGVFLFCLSIWVMFCAYVLFCYLTLCGTGDRSE